jgi:thioredoxin:protein disulfide reductase
MKRLPAMLALISIFAVLAAEPLVQVEIQPQQRQISQSDSGQFVLQVEIADGWHINSATPLDAYSVPTVVELKPEMSDGLILQNVSYPEGKIVATGWGGDMSLYEGRLNIPLTLYVTADTPPGNNDFRVLLTYQACNDLTCMSPETISAEATISIESAVSDEKPAQKAEISEPRNEKTKEKTAPAVTANALTEHENEGPFSGKNLFIILLLVFVMGLALNLTPCVYPLIPITMGYFLSQKDRRSPVLLALMYVIGLALTYSLIGTLAAFSGSMMGALLAHPATLIFFALLMIALSLSMFGVYEFRLPSKLTQSGGGSRSGAAGALVMGLTMGIVAAPCVGPFVVSLLSFVAQRGSVLIGFFTFFVLALGLGVPYLLLGIFSGKIASLPRSGEWLNAVRIFFGLALLGMAIYFILPLLSGKIAEMLLPLYMIAASVYYAVIDRSGQNMPGFLRIKTLIAMIVLTLAVLMMNPAASEQKQSLSWEEFSRESLQQALDHQEAVVIDFYADWCNPCKELEHITFTDPEVVELLGNFTRLKVDLTTSNAEATRIREEFDIVGVPTIVFYGTEGRELKALRLTGFEKPKAFAARLKKVLDP